jgi:small subunit ribosomal protein S16
LAVRIRLKRMGRKKRPFYRVVIADSRSPRDGRIIESVGTYDPLPTEKIFIIKEDRLFHWLDQGAQPSDTVKSLMRSQALTLKYELKQRGADEATVSKELQKWEMAHAERQKKKSAAKAKAPAPALAHEESAPEEAAE